MKYILWHWWLPFAFGTTLLLGTFYLCLQQSYRQNANDPQIQMAEDIAAALTRGADWQAVIPPNPIDISSSLSPFVIIYDSQGIPVVGNGELGRELPKIPAGIFDKVRAAGQDRVTWQPQPDVRSAIIVTQFSNQKTAGFVMVGRSLREVENRLKDLMIILGLSWVVSLSGTLIVGVLADRG